MNRKRMDLAEALQTRRTAAGHSQAELARMVGLDPSYICLIEKGQRRPSYQTLDKLAQALACTLAELLGEVRPGKWATRDRTRATGS